MDALRMIGTPAHEAYRAIKAFQRRDERNLRALAPKWRSDSYATVARESIEELSLIHI